MIYFLIALVNLIFLPSIRYGFISDDATAMKRTPHVMLPIWKTRLFSIILHIVVAEYIYMLTGNMWAAMLFSVHPMAMQVPVWVSARPYGLFALIFMMAAFFAPWGAVFYGFSLIVLYGIPSLIFTPLVFLFTPAWLAILAGPLLWWKHGKAIRQSITHKTKGDGSFVMVPHHFSLHRFKRRNLIIVVKTFGYYALACLLPMKNGFWNSFLETFGDSKHATEYWYSLNRHFWGGVFALCLMATVWAFNIFNIVGFGIMLFVLSIGPFLNFITVQQKVTPRYAYLPLAGYMMALTGLVSYLSVGMQAFIYGGLFAFYLTKLIQVMRHYKKNSGDCVEVESRVFPDCPRLWYYKVEYALNHDNPYLAWAEAAYGLVYNPHDSQLMFGLASASYVLKEYAAAKMFLEKAEKYMILHDRESMRGQIESFKLRMKGAGQWEEK